MISGEEHSGHLSIVDLATGSINGLVRALNKLIKLLPVTPINPEELKAIYEHTRKVLIAA